MTHGGARPGAGRKASTPDTTAVHWRVSESAKAWIKEQAMTQGVSIATIIDRLIDNAISNAVSPISELGEAIDSHPYDNIDLYEALEMGYVKKDIVLEDYLINHPEKATEILKRIAYAASTKDSCRLCKAYENDCPFLKNRESLSVYPSRPCSAYARRSNLSLLWELLE